MNKPFCDICGKPTLDQNPTLNVAWGPKWYGFLDGCMGTWEPRIELWPNFRLIRHPSAAPSSRPDLCADCLAGLLDQLREKVKPRCTQIV